MDRTTFRRTAVLLLTLTLLSTCQGQQSALFNQSLLQRRQQQQQQQQTQQLRQQLQQRQQLQLQQQQQQQQQQQIFASPLNPLTPLNTFSPISQILPQSTIRTYNQLNPQNFVPIIAYQNELNYDGSFAYGYAAGDGTTAQAQGYVKNLGLGEAVEAQVVQGSYSYTSPEGTPITVRYIADENGFRAEGAHIPTPPPIPEAIAKSLQYIASVQPYQSVLNPNLSPYQTPLRQFSTAPTLQPGQGQLSSLQLQQQRFLQQQQLQQQQQQNSGQYQPESQFGLPVTNTAFGGGGNSNQFPTQFNNNLQQQTNFPQQQQQQQQQQQNLTQQQNLQQQQQRRQQLTKQHEQSEQQLQQQLVTQELRGRPNQLESSFAYNPFRRFKKAVNADRK